MASRRDLYEDSVRKLLKFVPGATKEDFVTLVLAGGLEGAVNTTKTSAEILDEQDGLREIRNSISPIIDLINGGKYTHEILKGLSENLVSAGDASSLVKRFVRFTLPQVVLDSVASNYSNLIDEGIISGAASFTAGASSGKVNSEKDAVFILDKAVNFPVNQDEKVKINSSAVPDRDASPQISVVELLNPRIGTAVRDVAGLSIFCSMVPTHIMSRAVPYVSVKVYTPDMVGQNLAGESVTKSMNLIRYLKGEKTFDSSNAIDAMIGFAPNKTVDAAAAMTQNSALIEPKPGGMELFTSPQTLVTDHDDYIGEGFKYFKPIDRFRPLMTLNDLSFDVVSAGAGMMSYKQGSMNLTLHDRGRLSEISSFVKPGAYSKTEIEIEYGWSVDPGSSRATGEIGALSGFATQDDVFAQFLDSLRIKEKYNVVNSTFNFDDAGQVNVSLTLSMKGASDMRSLEIADDVAKQAKRDFLAIIEDVQKLITKTGERSESLFGETLMSAVSSPESALNLSTEDLAKVRAAITKVKNSASRKGSDFADIQSGLDKIFKGGGKSVSFADQAKSAITTQLNNLASSIEIFPPSESVYISGNSSKKTSLPKLLTQQRNAYANGSVSLGKVLVEFVGRPLAKSGQYDEIQFVFNKVNERAGFVRNLSMAAFPLDKAKLEKDLKDLFSKNVSVSLAQFVGVIGDNHVGNVAYPAYGFSSAYNDKGEYQKVNNKEEAVDYIDRQLIAAGISDCNFQQPNLSVVPEAVPNSDGSKKTILRIHVTDGSCTPYQSYTDALSAGRSDSAFLVDALALSTDQKLFPKTYWADLDPTFAGQARKTELERMNASKVLVAAATTPTDVKTSSAVQTYEIDLTKLFTTGDPRVVKRFFSESLPTIRYGSAGGLVKSISVSSISDPQLSTINILKQDEGSGDSEASSREKGLPLMVSPTEVSVEMLGCPIINFGQAAYIDLGTNTTIDNIYVCTNLSHKLAPGEFSTSAKFTLNVGAYGVYNSSKRSIDLTKEMLKQINDETILQELAAPVSDNTLRLSWGSNIMQGITYEKLRANFKSGKTLKIRVWNTGNASKYFKMKFDNNTEIVTSQSYGISDIVADMKKSEPGIQCYEFDYPLGTQTPEKTGKRYSAIDSPSGTSFILDMAVYNKQVEDYSK